MPKKDSRALTREFSAYHLQSSIPSMRLGLILTILLFTSFVLINQAAFPNLPELQVYLRFGFIAPFLILSVIVTYIPWFKSRIQAIFVILNLGVCIAIFIVGATLSPTAPGYEHYTSWVMLVIAGLFIFFRLPFRILVILGGVFVLTYALATWINGSFALKAYNYINNLFFIISVYSVGFFLAFILEKITWKDFIHQIALKDNYKKLLQESQERKLAETAFLRSEEQYHTTINAIPDWIYVTDEECRLQLINSSLDLATRNSGLHGEVIGKRITEVYPFITEKTLNEIRTVFATGMQFVSEQKMELKGIWHHYESRKIPIFRDNKVVLVMTIIRDRSKERELEELREKNAEQKEVMLREIHHRVKNNLSIVISLLSLQTRNQSQPELIRIIRDIEMRIRSMALIHEYLYKSENIERIPLHNYLGSLASIILGTFTGRRVNLVTDLAEVDVNIETALPLGLITNELLTNAFKYAFPNNPEGEIQLVMKRLEEDRYLLEVRDNGIGLPAGFNMEGNSSMGMFIVRLLVEQIEGSLSYSNRKGAVFSIQFTNQPFKRND